MTNGPLVNRSKLTLSPQAMRQWMFDESAGGIAISGDSGSGKSVLMRQLLRGAIDGGESAVFLLDPHGDLARQVLLDTLDMGKSVQRRTYYFAPGDDSVPVGPLNPLHVQRLPGLTPYALAACRDVKMLHTALLMLAAWGDENFDQKPLLFKWTTNVLRSVQALGLPLSDAVHFLDFGSPIYQRLVSEVPDESIRREFAQLETIRWLDREQMIASTKNRFDGILGNAVLNAHLGVAGATIDVRQLMEERAVVLVNLAPMGLLHPEFHQPILANFWLGEILHSIFGTRAEHRLPVLIACDELPVFRLSSPLIVRALTQIRKMKARLILSFQGTHSFPEGKDDRLLRAMTQCGTRFYFRHEDEDDATYFGGMASLPHLDPKAVKFEYWDKEQYQIGNEVSELVDYGFGRAYGEGETAGTSEGVKRDSSWSNSAGTSYGENEGDAAAHGIQDQYATQESTQKAGGKTRSDTRGVDGIKRSYQDAVSETGARTLGTSKMGGTYDSTTHTKGSNWGNSQQQTQGGAVGTHEDQSRSKSQNSQQSSNVSIKHQLVPVLDWRPVLRFMEFLSLDDQVRLAASQIARQSNGQAIMQIAGRGSAAISVPMPEDGLADTPKFAAKLMQRFLGRLQQVPFCYDAASLHAYRQGLAAAFLAAMRTRQQPEEQSKSQSAAKDDETGIGI